MKFIKTGFYIFTLFLLISPVEARFATKNDLEITTEFYNRDIQVRKDGSYTETIEFAMQATKESGKDKLVSIPLVYNAANTTLKVLEAKTILEGVEYPVNLKEIEDKPLASAPQGFDQNHQVLIAFPQIALNGKIYVKYQMIVKEAPISGFFSTDLMYGTDSYWQASKVQVVSELPLFVKWNDPDKVLDIKQSQVKNLYHIDIVLKKPTIKLPIEEQYMALEGSLFPWVTLSSVTEWSKFGALLVGKYEQVVTQKLPPLLEKIAKEAENKATTVEKINVVTTRLSENITYMGDWRTIKGALIPRSLEDIVKSKIGDCKDFSATTVAILRRLGLTAHVSLVNRGVGSYSSPNDLPNASAFNHAFVHVLENNQSLWIDPTNFTSFAQGIYPDIANKNALVLNPANLILLKTKPLNAKDSMISVFKKVALPKEGNSTAEITGQLALSGTFALHLTGADLSASKETINQYILSLIADQNRTVKWNIGDYNLTSRIVNDLLFKFDISTKHTQMKTTAGNAYLLPTSALISPLLAKTEDRVTDLMIAEPGIYRFQALLPKASLVGGDFSSCNIDSPWLKGSRKITTTEEGIQISDEIIIEKEKISNAELKSNEYTQFQNKVFGCFGDTALVYKH